MSWSASTNGPIDKSEIATFPFASSVSPMLAPDNPVRFDVPVNAAIRDQIETARAAAVEIAKTVPGPKITVSMSGHANAVGYRKKDGYANDCITVSVTQWCEGDWRPEQAQ